MPGTSRHGSSGTLQCPRPTTPCIPSPAETCRQTAAWRTQGIRLHCLLPLLQAVVRSAQARVSLHMEMQGGECCQAYSPETAAAAAVLRSRRRQHHGRRRPPTPGCPVPAAQHPPWPSPASGPPSSWRPPGPGCTGPWKRGLLSGWSTAHGCWGPHRWLR